MNSDFNRLDNSLEISVPVQSARGLGILRIFTILSAVIGQLFFVFSTIYFLALSQDYGNSQIGSVCTTSFLRVQNVDFCEFLTNWSMCSILGIVVGSLQILISIASASFRAVETKTNVWCAMHSCFLVILAPVFILTVASHHNVDKVPIKADDLASISKKQFLFIVMTGIDFLFSLLSIIVIPLTYGLEVRLKYTELINLE